jgi:hypothetical protein
MFIGDDVAPETRVFYVTAFCHKFPWLQKNYKLLLIQTCWLQGQKFGAFKRKCEAFLNNAAFVVKDGNICKKSQKANYYSAHFREAYI